MNINCFFAPGPDPSTDGALIRCLRNDGGRLRGSPGPTLDYTKCDVCGDKYTIALLEQTIKSTWEALRLGYQPTERQPNGAVKRLYLAGMGVLDMDLLMVVEDYPLELQPHYLAFSGMWHAGER